MRQQIRSEIASIAPLDALERSHIDDTLAWIDSGEELCRTAKPATPPRHLVSYFVCVDGDHVLLVDHADARLWLPTGGHVEPGEHPRVTVVREAVEELGIDAVFLHDAPLMITCTETVGITAGHTDVSLWYVLAGDHAAPITFDAGEFNGAAWFPFDDVPLERSDPHMSRFLRKLVSVRAHR
jgi:8-oxo-dGTP diphosphatase